MIERIHSNIRVNFGVSLDTTDIVYFIGSGMSAFFGMPTFGNIRKEAVKIYENLGDDNQKLKLLFYRVLKTWEDFYDEYEIEEFYSAMESLERVNIENIPIPVIIKTDEIMSVLYNTIASSEIEKKGNIIYSYLSPFISNENCKIITTNWDINIESLKSSESSMSYLKRQMINYGAESVTINGKNYRICAYNNPSFGSTSIKILKLNGSLNWGYCEKCDKIYYFNEDEYKKFIPVPTEILVTDDNITKNILFSFPLKCKNCEEGHIEQFIIPPTLSKFMKIKRELGKTSLKYTRIDETCLIYFTIIWREFTDYLMNCKKVYFIGYSFPITDMAIRNTVNIALKMNGNEKLEIIVITNKKCGESKVKFENNYLSVIPRNLHNNIRFCYCGFENYDFQNDICKGLVV